MRLYGKKFVRKQTEKLITGRRESRDGIVWDILQDLRQVRVKIQGSNELVVAWFPRNWEKVPGYLKPGNAIRITHIGGINRMEVVGHGLAIPTAVGGGQVPPSQSGANTILIGMAMRATVPSSNVVFIDPGIYRISGVTYTFTTMPLGTENPLGEGVWMGTGGFVVLDPPGATTYRYDAVYIGVDGILDYVKGAEAASYPVKPETPGGHVLVGDYILRYPGQATVEAGDIGRDWSVPQMSTLVVTAPVMNWGGNPSAPSPVSANVYCTIFDQYGNRWFAPATYEIGIIPPGTGSLNPLEGYSADGQFISVYTRDYTATPEWTPLFQCTATGPYQVTGLAKARLYSYTETPPEPEIEPVGPNP